MPARKSTRKKPKSKVSVKKVRDRRLLDDRLTGKGKDRFSVYLILLFLIFLLFVFSLFIYFFFLRSKSPSRSYTPDIIVPDSAFEELQQQEQEKQQPEEPTTVVEVLTVKISDTPTGFLNVRTGPSTGYSLIGQTHPGDSFEYVKENELGSWYEIRLASGNTGWVFADYAELITEQHSAGN